MTYDYNDFGIDRQFDSGASTCNISKWQCRLILLSFLLMLCVHMHISLGVVKTIFNTDLYEEKVKERLWIEREKDTFGIPDESSYTILIPKDDSGYTHYLGKFIFQTDNVHSVTNIDIEGLEQISDPYVLIYDQENEAVKT